MNSYETYIVAFLDILGFKNIIQTSKFDEVLNIFKSIITDKEAITALLSRHRTNIRSHWLL